MQVFFGAFLLPTLHLIIPKYARMLSLNHLKKENKMSKNVEEMLHEHSELNKKNQ